MDKSKALSLVLHCCDISHPAKRWDLHRQWTERLLEEFFRQGDEERQLGIPFSPLCDRNNTLVAESQIGRRSRIRAVRVFTLVTGPASRPASAFECPCAVPAPPIPIQILPLLLPRITRMYT